MSLRIALAGNPNCGKTTLFNALTGANQYVGNWPGVTVEKKEGRLRDHKDIIITDLPGIYSLSPYTLEEVVARDYILQEEPDAILNIVDATNLERNLYLSTQLLELGIPVVVALNMEDLIAKNGDKIDIDKLSRELDCKVVSISALKNSGVDRAVAEVIAAAKSRRAPHARSFPENIERALSAISDVIGSRVNSSRIRWYAVKLFERDEKVQEQLQLDASVISQLDTIIRDVETAEDDDAESIITNERYNEIALVLKDSYHKKHAGELTISDRIDQIVTNRWAALPIFALVMFVVYYVSIQTVGTAATDWVNDVLFGEIIPPVVTGWLEAAGVAPWLIGLIVDGIIAGVGAVLGFLPQMMVLFLFLAFLEGCGYMSRIAFIMDRIFRRFGLSGKSFIPVLVGTGCGVPGIMASRTIENERDRRMTVVVTTFIPCSAKLPIIALIAGALFNNSGLVGFSAYMLGIASIIISGIMLKKTKLFAGDPAPFVMELPAYHWPTVGSILRSVWERAFSFVKKAGTVILLATILVWFLSNFGFYEGTFRMLPEEDFMAHSVLAVVGNALSFIFAPLGFGSWKPAVAAITGLIAKENVVGTFGILYRHAGEISENGNEIWANVARDFTPVTAYAYLAFNLLCAPCFAAIGAIKREMNSRRWTMFAIAYQCGWAYVVALMINQFGAIAEGRTNAAGLFAATVIAGLVVFQLLRPYREADKLSGKVAPEL
jgi:ferrous iron transport protein B